MTSLWENSDSDSDDENDFQANTNADAVMKAKAAAPKPSMPRSSHTVVMQRTITLESKVELIKHFNCLSDDFVFDKGNLENTDKIKEGQLLNGYKVVAIECNGRAITLESKQKAKDHISKVCGSGATRVTLHFDGKFHCQRDVARRVVENSGGCVLSHEDTSEGKTGGALSTIEAVQNAIPFHPLPPSVSTGGELARVCMCLTTASAVLSWEENFGSIVQPAFRKRCLIVGGGHSHSDAEICRHICQFKDLSVIVMSFDTCRRRQKDSEWLRAIQLSMVMIDEYDQITKILASKSSKTWDAVYGLLQRNARATKLMMTASPPTDMDGKRRTIELMYAHDPSTARELCQSSQTVAETLAMQECKNTSSRKPRHLRQSVKFSPCTLTDESRRRYTRVLRELETQLGAESVAYKQRRSIKRAFEKLDAVCATDANCAKKWSKTKAAAGEAGEKVVSMEHASGGGCERAASQFNSDKRVKLLSLDCDMFSRGVDLSAADRMIMAPHAEWGQLMSRTDRQSAYRSGEQAKYSVITCKNTHQVVIGEKMKEWSKSSDATNEGACKLDVAFAKEVIARCKGQ
jgi:hypothetical protein